MTGASRPIGIIVLTLVLGGLPGCYDSHDLDLGAPGRDASVGDLGRRDAAQFEDGSVIDANLIDGGAITNDAGQTACQQDFVADMLRIPTLASGVGFDLDGGGTQLGCGVDGADGVDNGLAGFVVFADSAGVDIPQLLTAAFTLRLVRVRVRLNQCRSVPTIAMVDTNGRLIGRSRPAVVAMNPNGGFTFRGSVEQVPFTLRIRGFEADLSMDEAQLTGTVIGNTVSSLVIGGELPRERVETLADDLAGIADLPPDVIEDALLGLLDLHIDSGTGGCTALSAAFQGTGTVLQLQ